MTTSPTSIIQPPLVHSITEGEAWVMRAEDLNRFEFRT